ncbi:MAG: TSUP family transporter [Actinobacteria bacterium]|nr:TSUP family transporter [Actinomycetota bacterium]
MSEPAAIGLVMASLVLGALSSGIVGLGFPIVVIPAMALGFGLEIAVVVSALPALAIDLANLLETWNERHDARGLVPFGAIAAASGAVGALTRSGIDEKILIVVLVIAVGGFVVNEFLPKAMPSRRGGKATSVVAPVLGGLLQSTVGISSPVTGTYFLNRTNTRDAFIFHLTSTFVVVGIVRLFLLVAIGSFTYDRWLASIGLIVLGLAGRAIGSRVGRRLDRTHFRRIVVGVLATSLIPLTLQAF